MGFDVLKTILRYRPKTLILYPESSTLQVFWEDKRKMDEFLSSVENLEFERHEDFIIIPFGNSKVFRVFALLYEEVDFFIKKRLRVEEFVGSIISRWKDKLKDWEIYQEEGPFGSFKLSYRLVDKATLRFARINEDVKFFRHPSKINFFGVFFGSFTQEMVTKTIFGVVSRNRMTFRSESNSFVFGEFAVKIFENSVVIVHIRRAIYRVVYEKLLSGEYQIRRILMPIDAGFLKESIKRRLEDFGFQFQGNTLKGFPDFPINLNVEGLLRRLNKLSGLEGDEEFVRSLADFISQESWVKDVEKLMFELFMRNNPYQDPSGRVIVFKWKLEDLRDMFGY